MAFEKYLRQVAAKCATCALQKFGKGTQGMDCC